MTTTIEVSEKSVLHQLRTSIKGSVFIHNSDGYHEKRKELTWNGRIPDRFPFLVIIASSEIDIIETVKFARRHKIPISPRGSGHSYSSIFLSNGGILLDISQLRDIQINKDEKLIKVQSGATSGQVCEELAQEGLAFPVGHAAPVGIGGFLLGGGLGINCSAWGGMSTFNVIAADLITADGQYLHVNKDKHRELYWAVRGGGPGLPFIVTRFYLRCYQNPEYITENTYTVRFSELPILAETLDSVAPQLDQRLQIMLALPPAPPEIEDLSADCGRVAVLTTIAFANSAEEASRMQKPLSSSPLLSSSLGRTESQRVSIRDILDQADQILVSERFRTDNILTNDIHTAVQILMKHLPNSPSSATLPMIIWRGTTAQPDAAFSISGHYFISTYAQWDCAEDDKVNGDWLMSCYDELADIATGSYINEYDIEGRGRTIDRCYSLSSWGRLHTLRQRFDPNGVFRFPFPVNELL